MALATIEDGAIAVVTDYHERAQIRLVSGASYQKEKQCWVAPLTWSTCVTLRGVFGESLRIHDDLARWAWHERQIWVDDAMRLRQELDIDGTAQHLDATTLAGVDMSRYEHAVTALQKVESTLERKLFGIQRVGAVMMALTGKMVLADDMGLGKSTTCIVALRTMAEMGMSVFPVLLVAPNSVKRPWAREFAEVAPMISTVVVTGSKKAREQQIALVEHGEVDVAIINWESLRLHSRQRAYGMVRLSVSEREPKALNMVNFRTTIADEAHRGKEPMAQQTRALWGASESSEYRFAVTGTPLVNLPEDFWSLLHFIDPVEWESRTRFVDRYTVQSLGLSGRIQSGLNPNTEEEFFRVVDPHFRRIPFQIGLPQLPPMVYERHDVEMTPAQNTAYVSMRDTMVAELLNGEVINATTVFARLTRLLQFSSAMATLNENNEVDLAKPSCKVQALLEILDGLPEEESVVVFGVHRKLVELAGRELERQGISHAYITGAITERDRDENVQAFQAGKIRVMLCTIAAGGVGLTLTRARVAVFLQRSWSNVENAQAEGRIHRIGSEKHENVLIIDLVTKDSVEEGQIHVVMSKMDVSEELLRDREFITRLLGTITRRRGER